ncbi:MAG: Peptidase M16 domain protein [Parcubacteria group bacterium GW2011_GWA2_47_10b]|nr:MAG: Peptidase M16 domain protein [Parcubacteria group bacterium GW2011_GWA2_47_10b]
MKMYWDDPRRYVWSLLEGLIYGDNSYGWDVLGPARNIQKIKRSAFVNYWRSQYVASNTIVVIAGNVSESTTFSKVESVFSGLRTGKYAKEPPMKKVILGPRVRIFEKNTDQSHVVIGALGYSLEHKDRLVADVLSTILGGYMSSRLWSDIRGKHGLAYHVHAEHQPYKHTGYFAAYAGVPHERREETIRRIIGHLEKIKKSGVTKEELSRAKENIKGRMAISLESSDEVATFLGTQEVLLGKIKTPDELKKRIEKITGEDIARVAKSLFQKDKVYLAIIGPHLKEEAYDGILRSI